jgi:hypothetical protein
METVQDVTMKRYIQTDKRKIEEEFVNKSGFVQK